MPDQPKTFYLTTPIYYVNARPHIGHAYSTIVADVLARRHRLLGDDTYFLTGTDEHGQKIERSAAAAGIPPQQFADQVSRTFADLWQRMGITHNQFIRTTDAKHKRGVQKLFRTLYDNGHIELKSYVGQYCVSDEAFVDVAPGEPCPDCGRITETLTEENFFFKLSNFQGPLLDLIESNQLLITPDSARNEVLSFIRGNVLAASLQDAVILSEARSAQSKDPEGTKPAATADSFSTLNVQHSAAGTPFAPGALKDLSISRSSFTWGIPVPEEILAKEKAKDKHVIYVWLDALANYITALGYGSPDDALFQTFWMANQQHSPLHLVGKEITRFHCVYWPAFLLAAGLPTPKQVTANGWLLFDNSKMSKSKGNVVRAETILDAFGTLCPPPLTSDPADRRGTASAVPSTSPSTDGALAPEVPAHDRDLFAADVLRYYLLREIPFGQDGSFSFDSLITRYNADLANGYGNLVSRTLNMISQYFNGQLPDDAWLAHELFPIGKSLVNEVLGFEPQDLTRNVTTIVSYVGQLDAKITETAPWKLAKSPEPNAIGDLKAILYQAAESIRIITALLYPVLPYATARVWQQLGLGDIEAAAANGELTNLQWGGLKPGTKLGPLGPIFPRADKGLAQAMIDIEESNATPKPADTTSPAAPPRTTTLPEPTGTLSVAGSTAHTTGPEPTPPPLASSLSTLESQEITIDDFAKIELRVAQITLAERIPKADKLLRLEVDLGSHGTRQILSGIAEFYTPEELVGKRIVVITNLAPRKMRGLISHGMLLAASDGDHGKPHLAACGDDIALGSRLK